jgi:hypothetical protein
MRVTLAGFSLAVLIASCGISSACPAAQECPTTEIAVNSFGVSADVVLTEGGRKRRADVVAVDVFYFTRGEWQSVGTITQGFGGFGWEAEQVGKYKFIIKREGFKTATLIVNVRSLRGRWNKFSVPLKTDGCERAKLTRAGVK